MAWKKYFEPVTIAPLLHKDRTRCTLYSLNVGIYYLLQLVACVAIVNFYGDSDRFFSCDIDNYRKPLDAAEVFDKPLFLLAIYHLIEWVRTTLLLAVICMGSDLYWLMYAWYFTFFNTLFGIYVIARTMETLASPAGKACSKHQQYRAEWLRIEVVLFWLCFVFYSLPVIALRFCSKESHDEILAAEDESDGDDKDD